MSTNNIITSSIQNDAQSISVISSTDNQAAKLQSQLQIAVQTFNEADQFSLTNHQRDELVKLSMYIARGEFSEAAKHHLIQLSTPPSSVRETSTAITETKEEYPHANVSMSDLLAMMLEIIESSHKLRSEVMQNRINEASTTRKLAISLAADKCHDARVKFGITLAASVVTMGVSTFATIRMSRPKTLQDRHVRNMSGDENVSVKSLDAKTRNDFSARLQEARTGKYRGVSQGAEVAQGVVGNVNEMQNAAQIRNQEETQATKDMKEKFDASLDQYIQNLTQDTAKLNDILDSMTKANLVTNR